MLRYAFWFIFFFLFGKGRCPYCLSKRLVFDNWMDINRCLNCGAVQTTKGWTGGKRKAD